MGRDAGPYPERSPSCPPRPLCIWRSRSTAPAGIRPPGVSPTRSRERLFTAGYWSDLAQQAERGLLDFVTIEDGLEPAVRRSFRRRPRTDRVRGRLDAILIAARVAPVTRHIGFVPTAITTHTEPFHLSKAIATLDYVSTGRAGIRVQVGARADEAAHFGRRESPPLRADRLADPDVQRLIADRFDEAADYVEVLRRLWDSWEDDAEIRDVATGRFVDRDKLHYIDFEGRWFSVKGPSITPRPPQGQPIVAALGHADRAVSADRPLGRRRVRHPPRRGPRRADRGGDPGRAGPRWPGRGDRARLRRRRGLPRRHRDRRRGAQATSRRSGRDRVQQRRPPLRRHCRRPGRSAAGLAGRRAVRLPASPGHGAARPDPDHRAARPELQRRGLFRTSYEARTLRGLLGLGHPANRYAAT